MFWYDHIVDTAPRSNDYDLKENVGFARPEVGTWTPVEQAIWALGVYGADAPKSHNGWSLDGRLTQFEANPGVTDPRRLGDMDRAEDRDNLRASTFTISGRSYEDAVQQFNFLAVDKTGARAFDTNFERSLFPGVQFNPEVYHFGDGLPLVPPTPALVAEMLAQTDRAPDEILGKMRLRGGIITVEKVAINAVMAGAKPETFPVVLAALEAIAGGYTYSKMFHHAFSTGGPYGFVMVVAGPIVEELGILDDDKAGTSGAGNDVLNTIGRAIRMCIRNIGHNRVPNIDTTGRVGKRNDHMADIYAENMKAIPEGWRPHSEMMGFPVGSSTISMKEYNSIFSLREFPGQGTSFAAEPNAYTLAQAITQLSGRIATGNSNIVLIPPALAAELRIAGAANGGPLATTEALKARLNTSATANFWPIVVGTDPGMHRTYTLDTAGNTTYATALVQKKGDPIAPSAPQNFTVTYSEDRRTATVTWEPPARDGGSAINAYEVSATHGLSTVFTAPATANFPTGTTAGMLGGGGSSQGMRIFRLSADARSYTFENLEPGVQGFFMVRAVNGVRNNVEVQGMTNSTTATYGPNAFNRREAGVGSWAHFAEPPVDLSRGPGRFVDGIAVRNGLGTPRHFRAEFLDGFYAAGSTLVRAPATGNVAASTQFENANLNALMAGEILTGNQIAAMRTAIGGANVSLTYNSRWFGHLRDGRLGRLEVTVTSENADASDAFVLAFDQATNTTKAINEVGFVGPQAGLTARGMIGTGAAGNWTINTGVFNHGNFTFFATEGGTYTVTFALKDIVNNNVLTSQSVTVTVNAPPAA